MVSFRIPSDVFNPVNYKIKITTNMEKFVFNAEEIISLELLKPTRKIRLKIKELKILSVQIIHKGKSIKPKIKLKLDTEDLILLLSSEISGNVVVKIDYSGINNDGMYGFYRSSYDNKGKKEYILSSQFENSDARAAFPSFDDPIFKSTFDITLVVKESYDAISNMPISKVEYLKNGMKAVTFMQSPKMSTYLLYLGVGKFEYNTGMYNGKPIRIVTIPGKRAYTNIALEYAKKFLAFYENYFGIKYQMPKLDLIAVPDFSAGAMENWGAITFREVSILGNNKSDMASRCRIAEVIAHEFVHQWFGDLVTMKWWDDIWLNESFAEFMSSKSIGKYYPEFKYIETAYVDNTLTAMSEDHLKKTRAIYANVKSVEDISAAFGGIIYQKGASILRMLEDFIGPKVFRNGLQAYLKKYSYSNASRSDLWDALDDAAKKEGMNVKISKIVNDWIVKEGYPIVEIKRDGNYIILRQKRFFLSKNFKDASSWPIPIKYITSSGVVKTTVMDKAEHKIAIGKDTWIKLNYGQYGYYRSFYSKDMLIQIINAIKSKKLRDSESIDIISNLFIYLRSGRLEIEDFTEAANALFGFNVQADLLIISYMRWLNSIIKKEQLSNLNVKMLNTKISKNLSRVGWHTKKNDNMLDISLRSSMLFYLSMLDYKPVVLKLSYMFKKYEKDESKMDANLRSIIYANAAFRGDLQLYSANPAFLLA
ncbi:MAG: M1 family metallopeptidase, partial [Candidatus Marsarchaeota archaeon]|nr:M1 family metallopeptidase [Candidatus Marsarchaeota archaeon]